jgi:hypothetical protein
LLQASSVEKISGKFTACGEPQHVKINVSSHIGQPHPIVTEPW